MNREEQIQRVQETLKRRRHAAALRRQAAHELTAKKRADEPPTPRMLECLESMLEDSDLGAAYLRKKAGRDVHSCSDLNYWETWQLIRELGTLWKRLGKP